MGSTRTILYQIYKNKALKTNWTISVTLFCSSLISNSLREKCPNTEFYLVLIFLYSDWIQENTDQKKLHIWTLFAQWKEIKEITYLKEINLSPFTIWTFITGYKTIQSKIFPIQCYVTYFKHDQISLQVMLALANID